MGSAKKRGERFLRLASMTTSVVGKHARARVQALFVPEAEDERSLLYRESGQLIAQTLGELKGAVMKVGQMASIANDLLPPELTAALGRLQKEAPPVAYEVIAEQIENELGSPPELLFNRFDREPFASASIGQVHRARTDDGREVVVKVQYPGVDESVDADLAQLKFALKAAGLVRLSRSVLNQLFDEVRARLHEELDYTLEAGNVRHFRQFHLDRQDRGIVIPDVVGERSAQRVLTLTYEPGDPITGLGSLGYSQELRDRIGENLVRTLAAQMFELHTVHTDPNPANFTCRRDGSLVIYDFGCIKQLSPDLVASLAGMALAMKDEDYQAADERLIELGARIPHEPAVPAEVYARLREILWPLLNSVEPYDFGPSRMRRQLLAMVPMFREHHASLQPPVRIVFFNRMLAGHFGNLRQLGSRFAFAPLLWSCVDGQAVEPIVL
jgi:predicted unusual protein kinase regulating ubiquinone biosynthesis (AarF/ABC1/UbiB family)